MTFEGFQTRSSGPDEHISGDGFRMEDARAKRHQLNAVVSRRSISTTVEYSSVML